jgi:hypothetical protein
LREPTESTCIEVGAGTETVDANLYSSSLVAAGAGAARRQRLERPQLRRGGGVVDRVRAGEVRQQQRELEPLQRRCAFWYSP